MLNLNNKNLFYAQNLFARNRGIQLSRSFHRHDSSSGISTVVIHKDKHNVVLLNLCLSLCITTAGAGHFTKSCSRWKLDECNNQNPPTNLLSATQNFFVLFCFAFLAGAIDETSHPLHIVVAHGQSKQQLKHLLRFLISSKFGLYWQGRKSKYIYRYH